MANKKLRNFEFANHTEKAKKQEIHNDELVFFQCRNGSVFLICQDNDHKGLIFSPARLAAERIRYYLENEYVENAQEAVYNALIYTNGFIYEYARKNKDYEGARVKCACLLIRDNQVYFSSLGKLRIYFHNGRKLFLVSRGLASAAPDTNPDNTHQSENTEDILLGAGKQIHPWVNKEPLRPINNDMLMLCSESVFKHVSEKNMMKILCDPMPVQTKVYRLIDMAKQADAEQNMSIQLISFYNIEESERQFVPLSAKETSRPVQKEQKPKAASVKVDAVKQKLEQPLVKMALILLGFLLVAYMVYDIFIYNPMPPQRIERVSQDAEEDKDAVAEEKARQDADQGRLPSDTLYTIQRGDTWSRIYQQFGVCSWFIRNHEPNQGKFADEESLPVGMQIHIPLLYSAREAYNPHFFREFSLQRTGTRCEYANREFLDRFEAENL